VRDVCGEVTREAAAGGSDLVIEASAPVIGLWDRARVKQIVSNLVINAVRYGGGSRIEIAVRDNAATHSSWSAITARDRRGADASPVRLLRELAPEAAGGLGLGLWVVQTLCSAMGGEVNVENCGDGGARFWRGPASWLNDAWLKPGIWVASIPVFPASI